MRRAAGALAVAVVAMLGACGGSENPRAAVMASLAEDMAVPRYESLATAAEELLTATGELCLDPSAAAAAEVRDALAEMRVRWLSVQPVRVGPVAARRSWVLIDNPVREGEIEQLIAAGRPSTITPDYLYSRVGSDQRGLRAMEYLLADGEDGVEALRDRRRCDYLVGLAVVIRDEAAAVRDAWVEAFEGGPPYRERMAAAEGDEDLDVVVNDVLFQLKKTEFELSKALGLMGRADPGALVEGPAGLGVADLETRLAAVRTALLGDDEVEGVAALLEDDLAGRLEGELDDVDAAIAALEPPLRDELEQHPERLRALLRATKALRRTVMTEVVSTLGVLVTFTDLDGDSG